MQYIYLIYNSAKTARSIELTFNLTPCIRLGKRSTGITGEQLKIRLTVMRRRLPSEIVLLANKLVIVQNVQLFAC